MSDTKPTLVHEPTQFVVAGWLFGYVHQAITADGFMATLLLDDDNNELYRIHRIVDEDTMVIVARAYLAGFRDGKNSGINEAHTQMQKAMGLK